MLNCLGFQRAGNNKAQNQDRNQLSPFIFWKAHLPVWANTFGSHKAGEGGP